MHLICFAQFVLPNLHTLVILQYIGGIQISKQNVLLCISCYLHTEFPHVMLFLDFPSQIHLFLYTRPNPLRKIKIF